MYAMKPGVGLAEVAESMVQAMEPYAHYDGVPLFLCDAQAQKVDRSDPRDAEESRQRRQEGEGLPPPPQGGTFGDVHICKLGPANVKESRTAEMVYLGK